MKHVYKTLLSTALFLLLRAGTATAQEEILENPGVTFAVQERHFRLNHELTIGVGLLPLDAFYKGLTVDLGYTYHFTDYVGWQIVRGMYSYDVDTGLRDQLQRDFGVSPTVFEQVQWMVGSDLIWSPFYGKMTALNRQVTYIESFFLLGGTVVKTNTAFRPAINFGLGGRVYSDKHLSFRLDVTDNLVLSDKVFNIPTLQLSIGLNFGALE